MFRKMNNLCYKIVATPDLYKILYERCLNKINFTSEFRHAKDVKALELRVMNLLNCELSDKPRKNKNGR
jgi:hypothetical protein